MSPTSPNVAQLGATIQETVHDLHMNTARLITADACIALAEVIIANALEGTEDDTAIMIRDHLSGARTHLERVQEAMGVAPQQLEAYLDEIGYGGKPGEWQEQNRYSMSLITLFQTRLPLKTLQHVGSLPGNEHVLVRYCPAPHMGAHSLSPEQAEQLIKTAQEHFAMLRESIDVPIVFFSNDVAETGRIQSIAERVEGEALNYRLWKTQGADAPHQEQARQLAEVLLTYFTWVLKEEPPLFLCDIGTLEQYLVTPEGRIALPDTDPILTTLDHPLTRYALLDELYNIELWVRYIQTPGVSNRLLQKIEVVRRLYYAKYRPENL